jgi:Flp pilus assembly protein TadG
MNKVSGLRRHTPVSTFKLSENGARAGQAMVEFLLVAPLFFFLIFAVFDFGRLFLVEMEVENAVQEAGRFASTGNHLPDPKNPGQSLSRVNSIIATLQQAAFGTQVSNIQISSLRGGNGSAGGPGDTVTISVTSNLQLMTPMVSRGFPNGIYTFNSSCSFKNEPFPPGNTN